LGYSSWSDEAYRRVSTVRAGASSREIFRGESSIDPLMEPKGVVAREARDSEHHPSSVPIVVAFDVTGSMGDIPTRFAQALLGRLMTQLVERGWVTDPQVLFAAIGDAESDRAPLQIGQFESGLEMDMWLTRIWLEGGGGDAPESYTLAHWFAARHTATDAWEKRGKQGYLFTIGDAANKPIQPGHVERVFGAAPHGPVDDATAIAAAAERYELFHVLITRGRTPTSSALGSWRELVGDRVLILDHTEAICELIGVVMGVREGNLTADQARGLLAGAGMAEEAVTDVLGRLDRLGSAGVGGAS
jgi:hypothetical protein